MTAAALILRVEMHLNSVSPFLHFHPDSLFDPEENKNTFSVYGQF